MLGSAGSRTAPSSRPTRACCRTIDDAFDLVYSCLATITPRSAAAAASALRRRAPGASTASSIRARRGRRAERATRRLADPEDAGDPGRVPCVARGRRVRAHLLYPLFRIGLAVEKRDNHVDARNHHF